MDIQYILSVKCDFYNTIFVFRLGINEHLFKCSMQSEPLQGKTLSVLYRYVSRCSKCCMMCDITGRWAAGEHITERLHCHTSKQSSSRTLFLIHCRQFVSFVSSSILFINIYIQTYKSIIFLFRI